MISNPGNGGQILALYVEQLLGSAGSIFLALVVILACLTTAIGCITAASEYFDELTGKLSYSWLVTIISISCIFLANLGLNQLIQLFIPVLFLLYPVCIVLILLGLVRQHIPSPILSYRATLSITFLFSLIDAAQSLPISSLKPLLDTMSFLPGFNAHMSWLLPGTLCFVVTLIAGRLRRFDTRSLQGD